jgi:hypothetical protein
MLKRIPPAKASVVVTKGRAHNPNRVRNRIFFPACPCIDFSPFRLFVGKIAELLYNKN